MTVARVRPADFLRSTTGRRIALEIVFGAVACAVAVYVVLRALGLELGYDYLARPTGFQFSHEWLTDFRPAQDRWVAFLVAAWNTVRLVVAGLVLASLVGVLVGVARLSGNWLVRSLATAYVEVVRNSPLLVQIVIWYFAVILQLPRIEERVGVFGVAYVSNRGLALPSVSAEPLAWVWLLAVLAAGVVAYAVRRGRIRYEERTGRPGRGNRHALAVFLLVALAGFVVTGLPVRPVDVEVVELATGTVRYEGGFRVTPEFAAVLVALVVYTGAFIAEIVRGAIQSLPRGQFEAAAALGLSPYQRTTLVVLPQALRTIIPPVTNQYLNLLKNSSLAVAVAYPEIVFVNRSFVNVVGHAVPVYLSVLAAYMALGFVISALMNLANSRVQIEGRS